MQLQTSEAEKKWMIIYPLYLDKSKSVSEGRRVPSSLAVDKPQAEEIAMVLKSLKLEHVVEADKRHPADFFTVGRVRVKLWQVDGTTPVVPDITSKKALLKKLGEWVPKLKSRVQPAAAEKPKTAQTTKKKQPTTKPKKKK